MRWRVDDENDLDTLEPLAPGSDEPLPGFGDRGDRSASAWAQDPGLAVVQHNPRALRLWLAAGGLGVVSLLNFGAAGYLKGVEGDLRALEKEWRAALSIDADRDKADRALLATQQEYGYSGGLEAQRELLYEAASARLERLQTEIADVDASAASVESVKDEMIDALTTRRRDFRRERIPDATADVLERATERLDSTLRRWRLGKGDTPEVHLTAARELMERLERMADGPTGLTIGAVAAEGLFVIEVDANRVKSVPVALSADATVHPVGETFVVVDGGVARAFASDASSPTPRWTTEADVGISAGDRKTVWLQRGTSLRRVDENQAEVLSMVLPEGARLAATASDERALVFVPDRGLTITTNDGQLIEASGFRRVRGDGRFGSNDTYVAGLDDRGRVLVAPWGEQRSVFSALRADLPQFVDLAVLE